MKEEKIDTYSAVVTDATGAIAINTKLVKLLDNRRIYHDLIDIDNKDTTTNIILRFSINLETMDSKLYDHRGPLFHRWLPDGEKDAIILDIGDPNIEFKIWFERLGYTTPEGYVKFDLSRKDIDPVIMHKQAVLDSGPVTGILKIQGLSEAQLVPFRNNIVGNPIYHKLGKYWVQLIYKHTSRLINILRINYGQYWIKELRSYDSRIENLTDYCRIELNLMYSIDKGKTWLEFIPDEPKNLNLDTDFIPKKEYCEYISKDDWQEIKNMMQKGYGPSIRLSNILLTNHLLNQGNIKHALIQGRTSLELSIYDFFDQRLSYLNKDDLNLPSDIKMMVNRYMSTLFPNMKFETQIKDMITLINITGPDEESTKGAVDIANDILHKGFNKFNEKDVNNLLGLLNVCKILLPEEKFRLTRITSRNLIMKSEQWKKYEKGD